MSQYPEKFIQEIESILQSESSAFWKAMENDPVKALRVNPFRGWDCPYTENVPWEGMGRYITDELHPSRDIAHFAGAYYMQDASAMAPVAALDPQPCERVADLCAAPGGKSSQIAMRMGNHGFLLSNEYDAKRSRMLSSNLERLGITNAAVTNADVSQIAKAFPKYFDAVLVDAPCSGEGMFRKDEQARSEWTVEAPEGCHARQMYILDNAAKIVADGGRIVYSTCTFNRRENEDTIAEFLERHTEFSYKDFSLPGIGSSKDGMLRLWPHKIRGEGHFVAQLVKNGASERKKVAMKPDKDAITAFRLLQKTVAMPDLDESRLAMRGELLLYRPENMPMAALREGVALCRVGKNYVEPDHALAMAWALPQTKLSEEEAWRFIAGETLDGKDENGWTVASFQGLPLGWGKIVSGTMKNHLPKGLRIRTNYKEG